MPTRELDRPRSMRLSLPSIFAVIAIFAFSAFAAAAQATAPDQRLGINPWDMRSFLSDTVGYVGTGVGSIRIDLPWQEIEPRPDVFDWSRLDAVVNAAAANRIS